MRIKQMYLLELENITPLRLHLPPAYTGEFLSVLLPHIIYISYTHTQQTGSAPAAALLTSLLPRSLWAAEIPL
ncbi:Protein N-terminal and lysine N-methyltransferase EFM7, partial [Clarias magur]